MKPIKNYIIPQKKKMTVISLNNPNGYIKESIKLNIISLIRILLSILKNSAKTRNIIPKK